MMNIMEIKDWAAKYRSPHLFRRIARICTNQLIAKAATKVFRRAADT